MKRIIYILGIVSLLLWATVERAAAQNYDTVSNPLSDNQIVEDAVIYPNPVTDNRFYVKAEKTIRSVEVINMLGQTVRKITNETGLPYNIFVNLPDSDKGIFMIRIAYEDKSAEIQKILVK